jgi:hypothetical protein
MEYIVDIVHRGNGEAKRPGWQGFSKIDHLRGSLRNEDKNDADDEENFFHAHIVRVCQYSTDTLIGETKIQDSSKQWQKQEDYFRGFNSG